MTGFEVRTENYLCCRYIADRLALPNLHYVKADVRDVIAGPDEWDAVFCCGCSTTWTILWRSCTSWGK